MTNISLKRGIFGQLAEDIADFLGVGAGNEEFTEIEEIMSLLRVLGDGMTTLTRGGELARIIELRGKDYSGIDSDSVLGLYRGRKMFFEQLPANIVAFQQSHRLRASREMVEEDYGIPFSKEVAKRWAKGFTTSYRTRHYLILATNSRGLVDRIGAMTGNGEEERYRDLDELAKNTLMRLKDYAPRFLSGDEVSSYWAWLLNGRHKFVRLPQSGWLDGALAGVDVVFPKRARHVEYRGDKTRYSALLYIFSPGTANATETRMLDGLYRLHREFSIWQIYSKIDKTVALARVRDKEKNTLSFVVDGDIKLLELNELAVRLQADELAMMKHRWTIEVFEDDLDGLESAVQEVRNVIESKGFIVKRESAHRRAQFFSRFPEFTSQTPKGPKAPPNRRVRFPTSDNAAHFTPFASAGEGLESCAWGPFPVMHFKTPIGSDYAFTFQSRPDKKAPGHAVFIGGTGSGKTTTICAIISQLFKYPNFRVLAFDRLRGLEVFTHFMGGEYLDILRGLEVNPLQLPQDRETFAFLSNWFQVLTKKTDGKSVQEISEAIRQIFTLDRKDRTLANVADAFGLPEDGSIRAALQQWITGPFSGFFTGERDALDFDKRLVSIDMTTLLDLPDVLAPMTYYLFHKLFIQARDQGGYAVFVDELNKYIANQTFAPKITAMLEEIRKTDGVFIGAIQSIDVIVKSEVSSRFFSNVETWVLFPDRTANREHFTDELRLNDAEYTWLTLTHKEREVLVKRKNGESVVINVDLAPLGELLSAFDSGDDAVTKVNNLRRERPDDWQEAYLRG